MLHEFLSDHRAELIDRCRSRVQRRLAPIATRAELESGIPLFIDQLILTLRAEQTAGFTPESRAAGAVAGRGNAAAMDATAQRHGHDLLKQGFTIDQVVHDYGDLCQAVTGLALERNVPIDIDEFRTLNRCLDDGMAAAVTEFAYQNDSRLAGNGAQALNERLGFLAHELRNHIHTATLAVFAIKSGNVGMSGATAAVLDRSLIGMRTLVDRSLAEVRLAAGLSARRELFSLADFVAEVKISAALEARLRQCSLSVSMVDPILAVDADRDILFSAVGNLLQNAFKFTRPATNVHLHVQTAGDRILISVEDHCGGLPSGAAEKMFTPFSQHGEDRSGLGLGLAISRRGVEANGGVLSVRDLPDSGCVFTIDLPRCVLALPPAPQQ